ncbi:MAG TPA: AMP-binding protein [Stellaceae bacterium]|nr:AMP-binding protein [Stellaceae bacterium]
MRLADIHPSAEAVRRYTKAGYWVDTTSNELLEANAREFPRRDALVDARIRLTYGEYYRRALRLAAHWHRMGLTRDDVIAIQLPNWSEFAIAINAAMMLGIPFCQFHSDFRRKEVEFILRFIDASLVVIPRQFRGFDHLGLVRDLQPGLPRLRHIAVVDDTPPADVFDLRGFLDRDADPEVPEAELRKLRPNGNHLARVLFTSGTTGDPKAVMHTHNTTACACIFQNRDYGITGESALLLFLPVGLNWGFFNTLQAIQAGCKLVYMDVFRPEQALGLIERERITHFASAPAGLSAMLNVADFARYDLGSLKAATTGGASCPIELIRQWRGHVPGHLLELYGMAEAGAQSCTLLTDDPEAVCGTVGQPAKEMGLKIVDESGAEVPTGGVGEILSIGPSIMIGYYNNPDANSRSFTADGWFHTGDLGTLDERGYLRTVGRRKEMIIRGGANIYPREIEEVLFKHPKVLDAAVIGLPDPRLGERTCACIVPRPGETLDFDEIVGFLRDKIATYKLPERVEIVKVLPRTPTGKIQKGVLRDLVVGGQHQ